MRKKTYALSGTAAVIVFLIVVTFYLITQRPAPDRYAFLKEPRITRMPDQKMVEVAAVGDPNDVGAEAFKLLFKTFYKIPGASKGVTPAPRTRWSGDARIKPSWTGYYALPIPDNTLALPPMVQEQGYRVRLVTWEYGDVAEILHVGPYDQEMPTIQKLQQFLEQQRYEIIGHHEEEYLKGPGVFLKGDPARYQTIIRYRVKKVTGAEHS